MPRQKKKCKRVRGSFKPTKCSYLESEVRKREAERTHLRGGTLNDLHKEKRRGRRGA